jgi:hypothetical protein
MGYDLSNAAGDYHQWKVIGWWSLLNIARRYGWQPAGTEAPASTSEQWSGGYFANEGQTVRAVDASSLASALEDFFNDVDRDEIAGEVAERMHAVLADGSVTPDSKRDDLLVEPLEYIRNLMGQCGDNPIRPWSFTQRSNEYLLQFIAFCRKAPSKAGVIAISNQFPPSLSSSRPRVSRRRKSAACMPTSVSHRLLQA